MQLMMVQLIFVVRYVCKMFMKSTTGVSVIKRFFFVTHEEAL
jgi:hypothetical protein